MGISAHLWSPQLSLLGLVGLFLLVIALERWLHLRSSRKRSEAEVRRLNNLHLLTAALSEKTEPVQMAEATLDRALRMFGVAEGYVLLRALGAGEPEHSKAQGLSDVTAKRLSADPLRSYLLSCSERWGSLMVFPDLDRTDLIQALQRDPHFKDLHEALRAEGLRTLVLIGLQVKDRPYGTLMMASRVVRTFDPNELRMMLAVGNQISVAFENYFLHRAAERHNQELGVLHRVTEELGATFDLGAQLQILRRELNGLLGATNFSMAFRDPDGGRLETVTPINGGAPDGEARADELAEYVLRSRSPLKIDHKFPEVARSLGLASFDPKIRTWAGVPINFSDGSMGVLAVADFQHERALDERQFKLLQLLASEAAVAIENARLFQREQRRARHLALLNELGRKATEVLSPSDLLSDICQQVHSSFGYELARFETVDQESGELVVEAQEGYGTELVGRRFKMGEGLSGEAAQSGVPVLANVVDQDERYIPIHEGVRSALSLPLSYRNEKLGVLSIESLKERSFTQQDVLTWQTLAEQLAVALHNARAFQVAREQAITDGLTGLKTHRYFMEAFQAEWRQATRLGRVFSLVMMDLDGFKRVNDRDGYMEGDKVLMAVARVLEARLRHSNVLARTSSDKFAILLPETSADQAEIVAERLRSGLAADSYLSSHGVTASFGLATFPAHGATPEEILRVADAGVYLAKHEKGNRVRLASRSDNSTEGDWDRQLLEAYLDVAVKRMFSTGPEVFNQYLQRFQQASQDSAGESVSILDIVTALAYAIDAKDHYTQGHSQAVSRLAVQIARQLGLSQAEVEEVRLAGILHDIGKIGIPESVLNKPSRLTDEEFQIVKTHASLGDKILEPLKLQEIQRIRRMVRHHHEFIDGRGYPDGLSGDEIPLGARILTIADSFDTMVSERSYKRGRSHQEAIEELQRCAGSHFDSGLVNAFVQSLETASDPAKQSQFHQAAN